MNVMEKWLERHGVAQTGRSKSIKHAQFVEDVTDEQIAEENLTDALSSP